MRRLRGTTLLHVEGCVLVTWTWSAWRHWYYIRFLNPAGWAFRLGPLCVFL